MNSKYTEGSKPTRMKYKFKAHTKKTTPNYRYSVRDFIELTVFSGITNCFVEVVPNTLRGGVERLLGHINKDGQEVVHEIHVKPGHMRDAIKDLKLFHVPLRLRRISA